MKERKTSLKWLDSLGDIDWDRTYTAESGLIRAGDMFTSWATHDQLHLRQLIELHRGYTEFQANPYQIEYAGQW
jgi:hypothetical protein